MQSSPRECCKQIVRGPFVSWLPRGCLGVPLACQAFLTSSPRLCCITIPLASQAFLTLSPRECCKQIVRAPVVSWLSRGCLVVVSWLSRCCLVVVSRWFRGCHGVVLWLSRCPVRRSSLFCRHHCGDAVKQSRCPAKPFHTRGSVANKSCARRLSRGCLAVVSWLSRCPVGQSGLLATIPVGALQKNRWPAKPFCSHPRRSAVNKLCARRLSRGCLVVGSRLSRCPVGRPSFVCSHHRGSAVKQPRWPATPFSSHSRRSAVNKMCARPSCFKGGLLGVPLAA